MSANTYHHGDLRTAMIEKGIEMIIKDGAKTLSLRKLAAACGVSHAAPYSHFANKDDLLAAIEGHITRQFAAVLKDAVGHAGETPEGLYHMCCAYVLFFARNPAYFKFIFIHSDITVGDGYVYEPYDFYREFMTKMFDKMGYPQEQRVKTMYAQWAMIHGLASIAVMGDGEDLALWEEWVPDMLSTNYLVFKTK